MSNTNTNLQTQTSNTLHNAIMEAGGKDRPPMLAPGNYNLPYKFKWTEKTVPVAEGSSETTTKVDACPNACEMWKAIEMLKQVLSSTTTRMEKNEVNEIRAERLARTANPLAPQNHPTHNNQYSSSRSQQSTRNRGKAIVNSSAPIYDQEPATITEDDEMLKEKEIDKLMALISLSFKKIYKPTNNNLRTSSNTSRANQDNSPRINRGTGYDNQRVVNVAGARENVGTQVLQERGNIQAQISKQIENAIANVIPSQVDASVRSYMSGYIENGYPTKGRKIKQKRTKSSTEWKSVEKSKSTKSKSTVKAKAKTEETLNGPT
ncbi:hypothetical protein Tco_0169124, partial [Tanacetum coccineum]